jgi:hypothetical protein
MVFDPAADSSALVYDHYMISVCYWRSDTPAALHGQERGIGEDLVWCT